MQRIAPTDQTEHQPSDPFRDQRGLVLSEMMRSDLEIADALAAAAVATFDAVSAATTPFVFAGAFLLLRTVVTLLYNNNRTIGFLSFLSLTCKALPFLLLTLGFQSRLTLFFGDDGGHCCHGHSRRLRSQTVHLACVLRSIFVLPVAERCTSRSQLPAG